jgi:hypothetical protein
MCLRMCSCGADDKREDAFKSRTSLKSCRRPTEKKGELLRKYDGRLREIESPLLLPLVFFVWVDDNVQVAMTNEKQKEAGTEAFPSLSLSLSLLLSRISLLLLSFHYEEKEIATRIRLSPLAPTYVRVCVCLSCLTSNRKFSPITTTLGCTG